MYFFLSVNRLHNAHEDRVLIKRKQRIKHGNKKLLQEFEFYFKKMLECAEHNTINQQIHSRLTSVLHFCHVNDDQGHG